MGHTTKIRIKERQTEYSRETRWESCVDPDGKEWVDREEKSAEVVTKIRIDFKPTIGWGDRKMNVSNGNKSLENKKERGVNQIT